MNEERFKYRLKYKKIRAARYISHLDLINVFQRTARRAGLRPAYSQGFNPHALVSVAQPLPVGMEGLGEYADIELKEPIEASVIIDRFNNNLPDGLIILSCEPFKPKDKPSSALVNAAVYGVTPVFKTCPREGAIEAAICEIMDAPEVLITKEKKGEAPKTSDIRRHIHHISYSGGELTIRGVCGNQGGISPSILVTEICRRAQAALEPHKTEYVRRELIL